MQRLFLSFTMVLLGCLAIPANLIAQDAVDYNNRGSEWNNKGEYDKAIADLNQALTLDPNLKNAYNNRAYARVKKGEYNKAIADCNEAIRLDPNYAMPYNNRAWAWINKGEYDKAIADCNEAIRLNPTLALAYYNRGDAWTKKDEYDKAIADFNQTLRINPKGADAYTFRGNAWKKKGEYDKSIADYNQALAVDPNYTDAYDALAWLQATCPDAKYRDAKRAFENANKAYQLDGGQSWGYIDTLAAAYAENGDFDAAKEWEEKAIALAATDKSVEDKDKQRMRDCLELYRQKKPYRQELKKGT